MRSATWSSVTDVFCLQITPTTDLKTLTPCFDTFKCGRLSVPLDYGRKDGPNAALAVQIYPATDTANYKGTRTASVWSAFVTDGVQASFSSIP